MRQYPRGIKILVTLMFVSVLFILPELMNPNFVFLGIFFMEGAEAMLVLTLFLAAILFELYFVLKRFSKIYYPVIYIYAIIGINSCVNLFASTFFGSDLKGFIGRIFGDSSFFSAFVINQFALALLSLIIISYAWANKNAFDRR